MVVVSLLCIEACLQQIKGMWLEFMGRWIAIQKISHMLTAVRVDKTKDLQHLGKAEIKLDQTLFMCLNG